MIHLWDTKMLSIEAFRRPVGYCDSGRALGVRGKLHAITPDETLTNTLNRCLFDILRNVLPMET